MPVPAAYQATYTELAANLASFAARVPSTPAVQPAQMWPQLNYASDQNVPFGTYALDSIINEIHQHAGLGATGITFHCTCPGLDPSFYAGGATDPALLAAQSVWQQTIDYAHSRGMSVLVECDVTVGEQAGWRDWLAGLSWDGYIASRARHAVAVAALGPDWMTVLTEPDSEATATGQAVDTISNAIALVNGVVAAVQLANPAVWIAAGCGTWMNPYTGAGSWVEALLTTGIDAIDAHIYPCYIPTGSTTSFAERLYDMLAQVGSAKMVMLSEVWDDKQATAEAGIDFATIESRNAFSFWYPLDRQLLTALLALQSRTEGFVAFSPSYPQMYQTALDPNAYLNSSPSAIAAALSAAYTTALQQGSASSTGQTIAYYLNGNDSTTPPPAPGSLVDSAHAPTALTLTWTWAMPQKRQMGVNLHRDGVLIYSGAGRPYWQFSYRDSGLVHGATYTYTLIAFDPWLHVSAQLTLSVTL